MWLGVDLAAYDTETINLSVDVLTVHVDTYACLYT